MGGGRYWTGVGVNIGLWLSFFISHSLGEMPFLVWLSVACVCRQCIKKGTETVVRYKFYIFFSVVGFTLIFYLWSFVDNIFTRVFCLVLNFCFEFVTETELFFVLIVSPKFFFLDLTYSEFS